MFFENFDWAWNNGHYSFTVQFVCDTVRIFLHITISDIKYNVFLEFARLFWSTVDRDYLMAILKNNSKRRRDCVDANLETSLILNTIPRLINRFSYFKKYKFINCEFKRVFILYTHTHTHAQTFQSPFLIRIKNYR